MSELQGHVRRAELEHQLAVLQRSRTSIQQSQRSISAGVTAGDWSGFARWQFDQAVAENNALWSEAADTIGRAEQATRQALRELPDDAH